MPTKKPIIPVEESAALAPEAPIPPLEGGQDAFIRVSLTRTYGTSQITLEKEIRVTVGGMLDQHREYDKLTQQLEWHLGRIALEHLAKANPNGLRPK